LSASVETIKCSTIRTVKTHVLFSKTFFFENRDVYDIVWKNVVESRQATDDNIIRLMRIARWVPKATNTRSEYVILITFSLQQCLHERASVLRHT
jgi:hypothetical protein